MQSLLKDIIIFLFDLKLEFSQGVVVLIDKINLVTKVLEDITGVIKMVLLLNEVLNILDLFLQVIDVLLEL